MSRATRATGAIEPAGVTRARARERRARIDRLSCDLHLVVPPDPAVPIAATAMLAFELRSSDTPLVVDFAPAATHLRRLTVNGRAVTPIIENGHVIVPVELLTEGANQLAFDFIAGDGPLNRRDGLLYSLFVPARASHAFPCFDQPDVKGRWRVSLELPADWHAVANGAEVNSSVNGTTSRVEFARTPPLPTYLVAFAAGRFDIERAESAGRVFRLFHLEPTPERLTRNIAEIADSHARALALLADYTAIPYPFGKLDIVAIPSFQFTGMEHPGAIVYDADALLLDEAAPLAAHVRRADVIAHETAHMWFGNLVTMPWFDDVWMKEVLASFTAARVVDARDESEEALRFFVQHYPPAYDIDRTGGALPIRQPLDNLDEAGLMYGPTLYHKAPIAMRQLERLVGSGVLRDALRGWLSRHAFDNAGWPELAAEITGRTSVDVAAWSRAWIESAGRPVLSARRMTTDAGTQLVVTQRDERGRGLVWPQEVDVVCGAGRTVACTSTRLAAAETARRPEHRRANLPSFARWATAGRQVRHASETAVATGFENECDWILPGGFGLAYGRIDLDEMSLRWLLENAHTIDDARVRAAATLATWDAMLDGRIGPSRLYQAHLDALGEETEEPVQQLLCDQTRTLFWRSMSDRERRAAAGPLEAVLRARLEGAGSAREKGAWFSVLQAVALQPATLDWLLAILEKRTTVLGLPLGEADDVRLAAALAVRLPERARALIAAQIERCRSRERQDHLRFIAPALSPDAAERAAFVETLHDPAGRRREAWVIDALGSIHHPLRAAASVPLIVPALDLLSDVHSTGTIFFPQRWVTAVLCGHQSREATSEVERFLLSLPEDYSPRLRALVLAAADGLVRARAGH